MKFDTIALHAGYRKDAANSAITVPIYQSNAYHYDTAQQAADRFALKDDGYIYTRLGNPTSAVLETRMAALEGGVGALATSSGHAAELIALLTILSAGDHVVSSTYIYGGTFNLLSQTLPRYGITTTFVNPDDPENFRRALKDNTKLFYAEQLGNPVINVIDVEAISAIAHENGIPLMIDNTVASPYLYRPIEHGADIVVESTTKYVGGHGSTMGGMIIDGGKFDWEASGKFPMLTQPDPSYHGDIHTKLFGSAAFIGKARVSIQRDVGAAPSPMNSFFLINSLETLSVRMDRIVYNTRKLIEFLKDHPGVEGITYPEIPESKYYELAKRDLPKGCSGLFCFDIKGGVEAGAKFINNLKLFYHASNFADSHSMVSHPASTTHSQMSSEERLSSGLTDGMIRVSVGLEDIEDLKEDLDQAIRAAIK